MKNIVITLVIINISFHLTNAQDIIDPYRTDYTTYQNNYNGTHRPFVASTTTIPGTNLPVFDGYDQDIIGGASGYTGEYMISLMHNYWSRITFLNSTTNSASVWDGFGKSYKMEVVSFPFTLPCFFDLPSGCFPNLPIYTRELSMPNEQYNSTTKKWGSLTNIRENGRFLNPAVGGPMSGGDGYPDALVTASAFEPNPNPNVLNDRKYLPHTIIKHTVYIHCGPDPDTDAILDSIVWIYDNTRGRMRNYPFMNDNGISGSGATQHDVVFMPELISKPYTVDINSTNPGKIHYFESSNTDWIDGGTINYFPFNTGSNLPLICQSTEYYPLSPNDELISSSEFNNALNRIHYTYFSSPTYTRAAPAPYSLYTTYLRNNNGGALAGYEGSYNYTIPAASVGIKQNYIIDKEIILTDINKIDQIIYNPSEVSINSPQSLNPTYVTFPTGYTFKTILGLYPSLAEVAQANTLANGGPFTDPKNVPVPVNAQDLRPANSLITDYPAVMWDDPSTSIDERFGYYYIENLGQITVETCVRIFDAKFEIKPGGTLIFQDYPQTLNPDRYTLTSTGGVVAKNLSNIQYLQNTIVTQPQHLTYSAIHEIYAGSFIDPDPSAVDLPYTIESGGDIEFVASDFIVLSDGFSSKTGSNFSAHISNISPNASCPSWNAIANNSGNNNRVANNEGNNQSEIKISPNPSSGSFKIEIDKGAIISEINIFDLTGRSVLFSSNKNEIRNLYPGSYIVKVKTESKEYMQKVIVN